MRNDVSGRPVRSVERPTAERGRCPRCASCAPQHGRRRRRRSLGRSRAPDRRPRSAPAASRATVNPPDPISAVTLASRLACSAHEPVSVPRLHRDHGIRAALARRREPVEQIRGWADVGVDESSRGAGWSSRPGPAGVRLAEPAVGELWWMHHPGAESRRHVGCGVGRVVVDDHQLVARSQLLPQRGSRCGSASASLRAGIDHGDRRPIGSVSPPDR